MIINIRTKFKHGDVVEYRRDPASCPWKTGRIKGVKLIQYDAFRADAFMIYYLVEPIEMVGTEHDNKEWILECNNTIALT